jgi:hypothetical protein
MAGREEEVGSGLTKFGYAAGARGNNCRLNIEIHDRADKRREKKERG